MIWLSQLSAIKLKEKTQGELGQIQWNFVG